MNETFDNIIYAYVNFSIYLIEEEGSHTINLI